MKSLFWENRFKFVVLFWMITGSAFAQTYTWKNVTIPAGGFVCQTEFSPVQSGLIYARTDIGGVYRWDNTNSVWVPLVDQFSNSNYNYYGGESIAPDPVNANIVYVAAGMYLTSGNGVILRSTDQGNTWTINTIGIPMGGNDDGRLAGERLAVDPNLTSKLYFGSRNNGLWQSTNSGTSWSQVAAFPVNGNANYGLSFVLFDGRGGTSGSASTTIYVGVISTAAGSNLYRSTNSGGTWSLVTGGPTGLMPPHGALASDGTLYLDYNNGPGPNSISSGQVWKLNTGTGAWTNISPPSGGGGFGGISVDASNPMHVVAATIDWWNPDEIYSSTNGGGSWTAIGRAAQHNQNGAQYLCFGPPGCTNPSAAGWMGDIKIDPFDPAHAFYGTGQGLWSSGNINTTPTGSITWTFTDYGLEETAVIDMTSSAAGGIFFSALGDIGGMRHTNLTQAPAGGMYTNPVFGNTDGIDYAELNTNIVARVGRDGNSQYGAYSTNNGQAWTPFAANATGTSNGNGNGKIAVAADGSNFLWAPPGNPVVFSTNNGGSWTNATGLPNGSQIASDRATASTFYGTSGGNLYVSVNGGANFASTNTFTGNGRPRAVFGMAGEVWVPTGSGLFRFTNSGATKAQIANVSSAIALGFGMHAPGQAHPAAYLVGTVSGTYGFFRCDDGVGTTWTRINDANHQFGSVGTAAGDETVYGRIYVGTNGRGILYGDLASGSTNTPTPTNTLTPTASSTSTRTPTGTPTSTGSPTASSTSTPTFTSSWTASPTKTPTATPSNTATHTVTNTATFSVTPTRTNTPVNTPTNTATPSLTNTTTNTVASTATVTQTNSPTVTPTNTPTLTPANTVTNTATLAVTSTNTFANTSTNSATYTQTSTPTRTSTLTFTSTVTQTLTDSTTPTPTATATLTVSLSPTKTATSTPTNSPTRTMTSTQTQTPINTSTLTETFTPSNTTVITNTATNTLTASATASHTLTATPSSTASRTPTNSFTFTGTSSSTPSATATKTATFTSTNTASQTPTSSSTFTPTNTTTITPTLTISLTLSATPTLTATSTASLTSTATSSQTVTKTATLTSTKTSTSTATSTASVTSTSTPIAVNTSTPIPSDTLTPAPSLIFSPTATPPATPVGKVVIYPNPADGTKSVTISVTLAEAASKVKIVVFTTAFRKVQSIERDQVPIGVLSVALELKDKWGVPLANGIYYVVVTTSKGRSIGKLLIQR